MSCAQCSKRERAWDDDECSAISVVPSLSASQPFLHMVRFLVPNLSVFHTGGQEHDVSDHDERRTHDEEGDSFAGLERQFGGVGWKRIRMWWAYLVFELAKGITRLQKAPTTAKHVSITAGRSGWEGLTIWRNSLQLLLDDSLFGIDPSYDRRKEESECLDGDVVEEEDDRVDEADRIEDAAFELGFLQIMVSKVFKPFDCR